jgi:Lung seven transmembrane receptor
VADARPSLGPAMWRCRILGIAHFVFGIMFAIAAMLITPESASPWVLLVIVPLTVTTTIFYVWIIGSINTTIRELAERKQTVKMTMYKRVWGLLLWSVFVLISFLFLNVMAFAQSTGDSFAPLNWKSRWYSMLKHK